MSGPSCSRAVCSQLSRLASRTISTSQYVTARTFAARQVSSSSIRALDDRDTATSPPSSREEARQRAWYLEDEDTPSHTTAGPSTRPVPRQPKFTRYDPRSTTAEISTGNDSVRPLPTDAPSHFASLHELLTTSDLLEPSSVRFLYTPAAEPGPDASLTRVTRRWGPGIRRWAAGDQGEGGAAPGGRPDGRGTRPLFGDVRATWEWVIVAQVKGRGKGVVARAERMIRLWLRDSPVEELSTGKARIPRLDPDTDWSIVPVGKEGVDGGTCINLFTEEGMERWDLARLWDSRDDPAESQRDSQA